MKALALSVRNLWPRLQFFADKQTVRPKTIRPNIQWQGIITFITNNFSLSKIWILMKMLSFRETPRNFKWLLELPTTDWVYNTNDNGLPEIGSITPMTNVYQKLGHTNHEWQWYCISTFDAHYRVLLQYIYCCTYFSNKCLWYIHRNEENEDILSCFHGFSIKD